MKKYVKPELFYERFELSQHIASCEVELNHEDFYSCQTRDDTGMGGKFAVNSCRDGIPEDKFEDYCYTNSAEGYFGS